MCIKVVALRF